MIEEQDAIQITTHINPNLRLTTMVNVEVDPAITLTIIVMKGRVGRWRRRRSLAAAAEFGDVGLLPGERQSSSGEYGDIGPHQTTAATTEYGDDLRSWVNYLVNVKVAPTTMVMKDCVGGGWRHTTATDFGGDWCS